MRVKAHAISAAILSLAAAPALAQPLHLAPPRSAAAGITATAANSGVVRPLPLPPVSADAPPEAFLVAARTAVTAGRAAEAYEALERAETRALSRSAAPDQARTPATDQLVLDIRTARADLAARDPTGALRAIDDALGVTEQAARQPPSPPLTVALPPTAPVQVFPPPPPPPMITYALLPGHWQLSGANYVWVPPETRLRRVEDRRYVPGRYVWRGGAWRWEPAHYAD